MLTPRTKRSRYLAGNICLVVFLALLFSVAGGLFAPGDAAASVTATQSDSQPTPGAGESVRAYMLVTTDIQYYSTIDDLVDKINKLSGHRVNSVVYTAYKVYGTGQVYGYVYLVYDSSANTWQPISLGVGVYVYDDKGTTLQGYQYNEVPIPKYTGGGGGGGAAAPQQQTTTTENATITQVGSTATIELKTAAIVSQLQAGTLNQVTITVPATVTASNLELNLTSELVQALSSSPVPVEVQAPNMTLVLPPELFALQQVKDMLAQKDAKLVLEINNVTASAKPEVQNIAASMGLPASSVLTVLELGLSIVAPGQVAQPVSSFGQGAAKVGVGYQQAETAGLTSEWNLNFFQVVPGKLVYCLTYIDRTNNLAEMYLPHFSRYALVGANRSFADMKGHWAQGTVELLASKTIISGIDANNFAPNRNITRAEFAALLQKMLGLTAKSGAAAFNDVKAGAWYYDAVQAAYQAGLVKGRAAGVFDPQANITRQEMAAMMTRTLAYLGVKAQLDQDQVASALARFTDNASIAPWAREAAAVAATKGIISGRSGGAFAPTANATRAESATMLYNLMRSAGILK